LLIFDKINRLKIAILMGLLRILRIFLKNDLLLRDVQIFTWVSH